MVILKPISGSPGNNYCGTGTLGWRLPARTARLLQVKGWSSILLCITLFRGDILWNIIENPLKPSKTILSILHTHIHTHTVSGRGSLSEIGVGSGGKDSGLLLFQCHIRRWVKHLQDPLAISRESSSLLPSPYPYQVFLSIWPPHNLCILPSRSFPLWYLLQISCPRNILQSLSLCSTGFRERLPGAFSHFEKEIKSLICYDGTWAIKCSLTLIVNTLSPNHCNERINWKIKS